MTKDHIMTSTTTRKLALLTARVMIAAGLAAGASIGMAAIAVADTHNSVADTHNSVDRDPSRMRITPTREQQYPTGLNGNLPQRAATVPNDQFKHLPFNPAMPGGD
jgi:hypothetical protein